MTTEAGSFSKNCIFCGNRPPSKTKEHVIPKWLIELTGNPKRQIRFGGLSFGPSVSMAFDQLTFPACEECKRNYSALEGAVKPVMLRLLDGGRVNEADISLFLDWMDKVRIGLWLGVKYLSKKILPIEPTFYVKTRSGIKDRMVSLYDVHFSKSGVNFFGVNSFAFMFTPSCFALRVNNRTFLNQSDDFLFAEKLGFPYAMDHKLNTDGRTAYSLVRGHGFWRDRLRRTSLQRPILSLYQPMIHTDFRGIAGTPYDCEHVRANSIDWIAGIGAIFHEQAQVRRLTGSLLIPAPQTGERAQVITKSEYANFLSQVFNLQLALYRDATETDRSIFSKESQTKQSAIHQLVSDHRRSLVQALQRRVPSHRKASTMPTASARFAQLSLGS